MKKEGKNIKVSKKSKEDKQVHETERIKGIIQKAGRKKNCRQFFFFFFFFFKMLKKKKSPCLGGSYINFNPNTEMSDLDYLLLNLMSDKVNFEIHPLRILKSELKVLF
ncbi:hypothetical protein HMI56_005054 [Coelomomyces lativittatus]|nr:hypothetical protein HMI56_005054 [Coelomomyces lativittatus]